jgi:2-polyprenyl-3-methyl-5-hydroxy-6-metoxy-1,4-benzoquinol methylase
MIQTTHNQPDQRWQAKNRDLKAHAILTTIKHFTSTPLEHTTWLDIGCGTGEIAAHIAPHVHSITAIDSGAWPQWLNFQKEHNNLNFLHESIDALSCKQDSTDIIICNQVYEHVNNPQQLIAEIYRILKPGGHCYFAGPNLLFPIEPHIFWPCIHWLPRRLAIKLLRQCGSTAILDAYSTHYWTLTRWLNRFEITNAIPFIVKNPDAYYPSSWVKLKWIWRLLAYLPATMIRAMTWLSPGFIFILRKPDPSYQSPQTHIRDQQDYSKTRY